MKKFLIMALFSLFATNLNAAELKTSASLTVWSEYFLQGYPRSEDPFSILMGRVKCGNVTTTVESKQSIVGTTKDNYITGVVDYNISKNFLIGVKSYTLQDISSKQMTDIHFIGRYGKVSCFTYMFTEGPTPRFNHAIYSEWGYTVNPFADTSVKLSLGFGNKAHLRSNQEGFSLVNTQVIATQKLTDKISIMGMAVYNPYKNKGFDVNGVNYAIGTAILL
jgi:hypothetical protein